MRKRASFRIGGVAKNDPFEICFGSTLIRIGKARFGVGSSSRMTRIALFAKGVSFRIAKRRTVRIGPTRHVACCVSSGAVRARALSVRKCS